MLDRGCVFRAPSKRSRQEKTSSPHDSTGSDNWWVNVGTAGDARVDLTWAPPSGDGGSAITGYNIHRGTSSGGEVFIATVGNVLAYTDTGLTNTKTFYYQVSAVNAVGEGPRSNEVSATPMVPDITNPTVTITSPADGSNLATTSVMVSGTASDDVGVEKVELSLDGTNYVSAMGTTTWSGTVTLVEGPNTIFARVTDTSGNTATASIAVTVDTVRPTAVAGEDQTANAGATVSFDASGSSDNVAIVSYEWDFGDGTTGTGETTTHTYTDPGTYTVNLTVRDAAGNLDTDLLTMTVVTEPETPPPGFQVSPEVVIFGVVGAVAAAAAGVALLLWRRRAGGKGKG
ncbi:MAG: PKD domain-containing protein [Thermoplasmata archaeon]